mmetsp:Transcript_30554/g.58853  ORF Transcript_30554/g.58853 Transcript_30554/m.58853 type:complete len:213 (+) Transcript_30554:282-920(+)|eukprot:CAMPEP_0114244464 /NCGR_PEP_ID=MMETSP0058-20121206/11350_1 /TAXON_ID=36894 /ORGANISM="Pyramimonas parkeae, CCMP726" /LENGTH=212 /DNA_ID=CAMNT_0001357399 /DNA_START=275 /DNA_END=913 /DNA_ORIENTATION=+
MGHPGKDARGLLSVRGDLEWRKRLDHEYQAERAWDREWGFMKYDVSPNQPKRLSPAPQNDALDQFSSSHKHIAPRVRFNRTRIHESPHGPKDAGDVAIEQLELFQREAEKLAQEHKAARERKLERDIGFRVQAKELLAQEKESKHTQMNMSKTQREKEEMDLFMENIQRKHNMIDRKDPRLYFGAKKLSSHEIGWKGAHTLEMFGRISINLR